MQPITTIIVSPVKLFMQICILQFFIYVRIIIVNSFKLVKINFSYFY